MSDLRVIGLGGYLRSGKDTVADHLVKHYGYTKLFMSDPLNQAMLTLNPWVYVPDLYRYGRFQNESGETVALPNEFERYQTVHEALGYTEAKKLGEVRRFLQKLGTDVGREMIDKELWTKLASKSIAKVLLDGGRVVITGMRFPNELGMISNLDGTNLWVHRSGLEAAASVHASENSVQPQDFDQIIYNSANLQTLYENVDVFMGSKGITRG